MAGEALLETAKGANDTATEDRIAQQALRCFEECVSVFGAVVDAVRMVERICRCWCAIITQTTIIKQAPHRSSHHSHAPSLCTQQPTLATHTTHPLYPSQKQQQNSGADEESITAALVNQGNALSSAGALLPPQQGVGVLGRAVEAYRAAVQHTPNDADVCVCVFVGVVVHVMICAWKFITSSSHNHAHILMHTYTSTHTHAPVYTHVHTHNRH